MLSSYLKVAFRNMRRHKSHTIINLSGLAIGIACSVLMLMWVADELSFDRFHSKADRIYRVILDPKGASDKHEAVSTPVLASRMKETIPEVEEAARFRNHGKKLLTVGDKTFYEGRGILADPELFSIFDFPFIHGDRMAPYDGLHSIVISESLAQKCFGDVNPVGKTINFGKKTDYTVTGVIADVPENSHLRFGYARPFELLAESGRNLEDWGDISYFTAVLLGESTSAEAVDAKIDELVMAESNGRNGYYLQPLKEAHLHSDFNFDYAITGNILYIYIFTAGAAFILLIACINFMNLATARSGIRAREVGMRKVVGAARKDIIRQFYGESILSALLATIVAVGIVSLVLPAFNELSGKTLHLGLLSSSSLTAGSLIGIGLLIIALLTGVISGSYPALFLSSFRPAVVLKGAMHSGGGRSWFRNILVVFQFSLTIVLLIGTMIVHNQLGYIRSMDLGYDGDHIVMTQLRGKDISNQALKSEFLKVPGVRSVTFTSSVLTNIGSGTSGAWWQGKPEDVRLQIQVATVDPDYLETFGMKMVAGEFFNSEDANPENSLMARLRAPQPQDGEEREPLATRFVVNEAAVRAMGLEDPIGWPFNAMGSREGRIVGVIQDFNYKSVHANIDPLFLICDTQGYFFICMKIDGHDIPRTLSGLEQAWKRLAPQFPFDYFFLNERIDALYRAEQRTAGLFNWFTGLAIFIACLGLFGMASFTAERRTKEIGIRKTLGASNSSIVGMLSKEFSRLVLLANIIAWPLAWLVMNRWLQSFAYRVNISIYVFAVAGVVAFAVAFITVASQALKAAVTDPVKALKYE